MFQQQIWSWNVLLPLLALAGRGDLVAGEFTPQDCIAGILTSRFQQLQALRSILTYMRMLQRLPHTGKHHTAPPSRRLAYHGPLTLLT